MVWMEVNLFKWTQSALPRFCSIVWLFFVYFCNCMCQVSMLMLLILFEVHMQHIFYVYRYAIYLCFWRMFHYFFRFAIFCGRQKAETHSRGLILPWLAHDFKNIKTEGKEQSTSNRRALEGHAPRCTTRESEKVSFNETPSGWEGQMGGKNLHLRFLGGSYEDL